MSNDTGYFESDSWNNYLENARQNRMDGFDLSKLHYNVDNIIVFIAYVFLGHSLILFAAAAIYLGYQMSKL